MMNRTDVHSRRIFWVLERMSTAFEILYGLAIELQANPQLSGLTVHHDTDRPAVEVRLREVITQLVMPGERWDSAWQKLRIFCFNYVNRAQPAVTGAEVRRLLDLVEQTHDNDEQRFSAIAGMSAQVLQGRRASELVDAIAQITSPDLIAPLGNVSYMTWIAQRWVYWANKTAQTLDADELLADIAVLSENQATRVHGMRLPLAANFFADLGLGAFAKPDLHVTPIINLLQLRHGEEAAFRGAIDIARAEHEVLRRRPDFAWLQLHGGLWPRFLDRLIYLIGSDNFRLDGRKNKRHAPKRREMMRDALIEGALIDARYK
jgi:hypothetical protein